MKMKNSPLYQGILHRAKSIKSSFHMPGHKRGALGGFDVFEVDLTELAGIDNLHKANGIIKEAQLRVAGEYGAEHSYFLVNGSTVGNHAAIMSQLKKNEKLLVISDAHKSIYTGAMLAGVDIQLYEPIMSKDGLIPVGIDLSALNQMLEADDSIKMIAATYPGYYGYGFDLSMLIEIAKKNNCIVLIDNAHGAHLKWMGEDMNTLPCPVRLGADIVVQSAHKTLPSLTQAGILHVNVKSEWDKYVDIERLEAFLAILQTTSPSYPIMASIDVGISYMMENGISELRKLYENVMEFKEWANKNEVQLYEDFLGTTGMRHDFTKLAIMPNALCSDGARLAQRLRTEYGIYVELESHNGVLIYLSIANTKEDFKNLKNALMFIRKDFYGDDLARNFEPIDISKVYGGRKMKKSFKSIYMQDNGQRESISLEESVGRICSELIIPYPPGIPVVIPGQMIDEDLIYGIKSFLRLGITVIGIEQGENGSIIKVLS